MQTLSVKTLSALTQRTALAVMKILMLALSVSLLTPMIVGLTFLALGIKVKHANVSLVTPPPVAIQMPDLYALDLHNIHTPTTQFLAMDPWVRKLHRHLLMVEVYLMLFDLNGPPIPLPVGTNLDPYIYNHPSWAGTGNDLGSIFGLAMDEVGNIYVSTSKTWNGSDPVGIGGWGAIYKVDTNDASISVWATLPMPNSESGLGSITYDCEHSQFFATSFEDGLIYRLDMSGNILDSFDHGVSIHRQSRTCCIWQPTLGS